MVHVYPLRDKRQHDTEGTMCWCEPVLDWTLPEALVVHNSLDGRETLEQQGKRDPAKKWKTQPK